MSCSNLPPGWEEGWGFYNFKDYCWERLPRDITYTVYRYTATEHLQTNFPLVGDEFLPLDRTKIHAIFYPMVPDASEGKITLETSMQNWAAQSIRLLEERWTSAPISMELALPEKKWTTYYDRDETFDYALLRPSWVEVMNPDPGAANIDHLGNIYVIGVLLFAICVVFVRYMSWIISLEGLGQRHHAKNLKIHSILSDLLISLLATLSYSTAFVVYGLIVSAASFSVPPGLFLWVVLDILSLLNLVLAILYVMNGLPSKNPGLWVMRSRLDIMVPKEWH